MRNPPARPATPGPLAGPAYLLRGLAMLGRPGLRHFVWIPLLINLSLFGLGVGLGAHYFQAAAHALIPAWLDWLRWLLWPLFAALLSVMVFFSFTLAANVVAAPFYAPLAAKVLKDLGVAAEEGEGAGFFAGLAADLGAEFRRLAYFALRALPLLLLSAIPVANFAAPFLWLLFGAWSLSLEYLAYPLEAQGLRFDQQREWAARRRWEALSFGAAAMLGLGVPLLNILIPPAAVVGATLYIVERGRGSVRQLPD